MRLFTVFLAIATLRAADPSFEVAVIRPAHEETDPREIRDHTERLRSAREIPDRYDLPSLPMASILAIAFQVQKDQVIAPTWVSDTYFTIEAKVPAGSVRDRDAPAMLRTLLAERFGAVFHREARNGRGALLERIGSRLDLPSAIRSKAVTREVIGEVKAARWHISLSGTADDLSALLTGHLGVSVRDTTGLQGLFDFDLMVDVTRKMDPQANRLAHNLEVYNDALKPMGLRLRYASGPVDVVVMDQLNRVPTEN